MGRIILTIFGAVLAVGLLAAAQAPSNGQGGQSCPDSRDTAAAENVQIAADLSRIASALEAQNANDGSDREQRDLEAQEEMAIWAERMFGAAVATVIVSAIGIGLIFVTFRETQRAADSAEAMAKEARAATEAAFRSAAVAEKALVGIERPFLVFQPGRTAADAQYYSFVNHGRTPCIIVHSDVRYLPITPLDGPEPLTANMLQAALTPDWNIVGPNGGESGDDFVRLGKPIVPDGELARMQMLHGYVLYRSLTDDFFVSGFGLIRQSGRSWKTASGSAFNYDERIKKGGPQKRKRMSLTVRAVEPEKNRD